MTTPATIGRQEASAQSLASGAAGIALLHIEMALNGSGAWRGADHHIRQAAAVPVDAAPHAGLFYGAPAIAFVLHAASSDGHPRYRRAARTLDRHVLQIAQQRVAAAEHRVRSGQTATFGEYDLFYGLTGLGVLLLHRQPDSDALANILRHLIRLTRPRHHDGEQLPGW